MTRDGPPDWRCRAGTPVAPPAGVARRRPGPARRAPRPDRCRAGGTFGVRILGVSEVTRAIRERRPGDDRLRDLWVEGEIGRVTVSSRRPRLLRAQGRAQPAPVRLVPRRPAALRRSRPQAGLRVVAHGRIDLFEPQGALQLYVESHPAGRARRPRAPVRGAQGPARGRGPVRRRRASGRCRRGPATIAVVTSPTGAVWKDIRHVLAPPLAAGAGRAGRARRSRATARRRASSAAFRRVERYAAERIAAGRPRRGARR